MNQNSRFLSFRYEIVALIRLALPVSLAQLAIMGMSATDVLIAGHAGTVELAGMNLGANIWNMVILFFMGIGLATQPLVAREFGACNDTGIKCQLHQSIWMCLGLGVIATLVVLVAAWLLPLARLEADMLRIAHDYLLAISLCAIPMSLMPAVRGTLEGMNLTRVVFLINLAVFLLNIPLNYALVNGLYGLPKLGGVGCAWATVVLIWVMLIVSTLVLKLHGRLKMRNLLTNFQMPDRTAIRKTFKLGLPIGVSVIIELSMFCGAGMLIAAFGPVQASAHAIAITIASMSFMLYMGLGQGVTIRVSQFLGAQKYSAARYTIKVGTSFNLLIALLICIVFLTCTEPLIRLFSIDQEVIALAVVLLYFGAAFQLADSLQVAIICALRAYHDTASPLKYQLVAFWIFGLPMGVGLAFFAWVPGLEGARGMWLAMVVSLFLVGFLLLRRLWVMIREQERSAGPALF